MVIPYSFDTNDMRFTQNGGFVHAEDFSRYCIDALDWLWREGERAPGMMSIGLHLRIIGRPGRMRGLEAFLEHVCEKPRHRRDFRLRRWREEVEALHSGSTVDDPGLRLGEGQPELAQHLPQELQGGFGLPFRPTEDNEVIRIANDLAQVLPRPLPRLIQVDIGQHGRDDPTLWRSPLRMEQPFSNRRSPTRSRTKASSWA